ncbi:MULTISPECIES: PRC-barrel domain-containing protein [Trichocoleus]|uniref:PRC-barrel domain-containing protein n=1 Tax=Trichocoleus desertorum GB2-A4 TaxID=2933944 RepID=A0ABV0J8Y8_9CYAN|nr:PRC-barrel domain-containing protein [Trichocoleus sp. FACHB-46]MBD1862680.1 PRC-barrel domain-containing protein [Trichocoleus sp. FACHB-46]
MASPQAIARQGELLNRLVLDRETAEELGRVDQIWMVPELHRVMGIICTTGFLKGKKQMFTLVQIEAFGTDSIVVNSSHTSVNPEDIKPIDSLIGREVWSDAGSKIGKLTDYLFDPATGEITQYLFVARGWSSLTDGSYLLQPSMILGLGSKRVMISNNAAQEISIYTEGLRHKVAKVSSFLQSDYAQTKQDVKSWLGGIQAITSQAKEQLQTLSVQAKEQAQTVGEQLKDTTQTLAEQAQEKSQTLKETLKDRAQLLGEQVKDKTQALAEQAKANASDRAEPEIVVSVQPDTSVIAQPTHTTEVIVDVSPEKPSESAQ